MSARRVTSSGVSCSRSTFLVHQGIDPLIDIFVNQMILQIDFRPPSGSAVAYSECTHFIRWANHPSPPTWNHCL